MRTEAGRIDEATLASPRGAPRRDLTNRYDLATVLLAAKKWEDAAGHFTEALALNPRSAEAAFGLGVACHQAGRLGDAIKSYRAAIDAGLRYRDAHYNLARALAAIGQPAAAGAEYRRALELDPLDAEAHSGLGALLAAENKLGMQSRIFGRRLRSTRICYLRSRSAWIFATSDRAAIRDPAAAVGLAERAAGLTGGQNAGHWIRWRSHMPRPDSSRRP